MKSIEIKITSTQKYTDEHQTSDIITVNATIATKNNTTYIMYTDQEMQDNITELIKHTIKIKPNEIQINILGNTKNSRWTFKEHHKTIAIYNTPYGRMEFENETTNVVFEYIAGKVNLCLSYILYLQGEVVSQNVYKITQL